METLATKFRQSSKDFAEHGNKLINNTKEAGQGFVSFIQGEAREWKEYIQGRYNTLGNEPEAGNRIRSTLQGVLGKLKKAETAPQEVAQSEEEKKPAEETEEAKIKAETVEA